MRDIILINLPTNAWYKKEIARGNAMPPLGLMYIATVLQQNEYAVELIDLSVEGMTEEDFVCHITKEKPKIIGISTYNEAWLALKVISACIKKVLPECIIVAGGAFATFVYKDVLGESAVDMISTGEGEYSILAICDSVIRHKCKLSEIAGTILKEKDGSIINHGIYERISNLDLLPYVNRDLVKAENYSIPYTISTSRGCPGACIFCSSRRFWGNTIYMRSAKNIIGEMNEIHSKYNSNTFQISDDTFTASKKRATEVCNYIIENDLNFLWGCESRADVITEDFAKLLKRAGCNKIQIGMESADNDVLRALNKFVTIEQIEKALEILSNEGMYITLSFIIGHAVDTIDTVKKTVDFAIKAKEKYGAKPAVSVNTPFPGTPQYENRKNLGIKIYSRDWDDFRLDNPNISTNNLSLDQLRRYFFDTMKEMRR